VICGKTFFGLQLRFAERIALLSNLPLQRVLLDFTNFYVRFGLGRDFDPAHPLWRAYLNGLNTSDALNWTYLFYSRSAETVIAPATVMTCGCFSYARLSENRIRLHFQNAETDGRSPLAVENVDRRTAELMTIFKNVKQNDQAQSVVGASWLYNLHAYRRLFPASYLENPRVLENRFRVMPLWGQFLDRFGEVRGAVRLEFLDRLEHQSSLEGLDGCFPFQVLRIEAALSEFLDFYGIG
jgi:hypothetical protein